MKKKTVQLSEAGKIIKEELTDKLTEASEVTREIEQALASKNFEFKYVLGKALREERVMIMAKPDKYRQTGKTTMITSAFYMKEDMFLVVSTRAQAQMYYPYIPKERILIAREVNGMKGRRTGGFILDEISFQEYMNLRNILTLMGKVMGIVSIYKDYEIL